VGIIQEGICYSLDKYCVEILVQSLLSDQQKKNRMKKNLDLLK
jgi:hypothetical protein